MASFRRSSSPGVWIARGRNEPLGRNWKRDRRAFYRPTCPAFGTLSRRQVPHRKSRFCRSRFLFVGHIILFFRGLSLRKPCARARSLPRRTESVKAHIPASPSSQRRRVNGNKVTDRKIATEVAA
jgi:hypothetical protein